MSVARRNPVAVSTTLDRLTPPQRAIATAPDGPLAVVAGPGAGKTATLAARAVHLAIPGHRSPPGVLALTFTAAAAAALRSRLASLLGDGAGGVEVATFHAFGLTVIRRWWAELGFADGPPTICDAATSRELLGTAVAAAGVAGAAPGQHRGSVPVPRELAIAVERARLADAIGPTDEPVATVAAAYEALLRERNAVDYAAMLALPLRLLRERPEALTQYRQSYRAILIDEAQDVCAAQAALARLLAGDHGNLTIVGDPRQTLYGWRGADARFLLDLPGTFPGARVAALDQNFRSTGRILDLANALGAPLPHGGRLWTANPPGSPPAYHAARDERDEAAWIAGEIARLLRAGMVSRPAEVAVLCRTNGQLRPLAEALRVRGLYPLGGDATARACLGTIHGAKGREWRVVFVTGVEEGLLPHRRAVLDADPAALDAERNVAFVAATRARDRLYLTACARRSGDDESPGRPSRFLTGLPADLVVRAA